MNLFPFPRVTPWVGRLIAINAIVLLLMMTVLTSPALVAALAFDPRTFLTHPWTMITYMFVHGGLLHLVLNMWMLFLFGSAVESRMGSRGFLVFYLACGAGAALFAYALSGLLPVDPFIGASGAILGVAVAFAFFWPDAELIVFPLPIPLKARTLVAILIGLDVVAYAISGGHSHIAHVAHIGGAAFALIYFRVQSLGRRNPTEPPRSVERVVMVQSGASEPEHRRTPVTPIRPRRRVDADPVAAEVDRVLDKISAQGMDSLTPAERRFLDEVSKRKKGE